MSGTANRVSMPLSAGMMYWLRGRAIGALIFAFFGASDALWALSFARGVPRMWSEAIWIVAVSLGGWSITQRLLLGRLSVSAVDKSIARQRLWHYASWFLVVVVIEVISINLGRPVLTHFHRLDLFPQWVEAVVGLHFLPLARLFRVPLFYATGVALVLAALGSLLVPVSNPRAITALAGSSLSLWATAVMILLQDAAYVRPPKR
jgi:hypothetical protein